ncbi:hypothetical protein COBT_004220, partial [Conglomerata obtusa]
SCPVSYILATPNSLSNTHHNPRTENLKKEKKIITSVIKEKNEQTFLSYDKTFYERKLTCNYVNDKSQIDNINSGVNLIPNTYRFNGIS